MALDALKSKLSFDTSRMYIASVMDEICLVAHTYAQYPWVT